MKIIRKTLAAALLLLPWLCAQAQPAAQPGEMGGPNFNGSIAKLFGNNSSFSATLEMQLQPATQTEPVTITGNFAFDDGKSRFELDMADLKGGQIPPEAASHMKSMGMDRLTSISRPDKKLKYQIYPGLQAYAETPLADAESIKPASSFKVDYIEQGKETVDGHECVKNKATVTDEQGKKHESTVWKATDLKNFPIKIDTAEFGTPITMHFRELRFSKPDSGLFDPPAEFKKYDNAQTMIQQEMMKRMGGGGMPAGHPNP